jgi:hypothetical protein
MELAVPFFWPKTVGGRKTARRSRRSRRGGARRSRRRGVRGGYNAQLMMPHSIPQPAL